MAKKKVIDLRIHKGQVRVHGIEITAKLPDGCLGICFVFESKKAAYNFGSRESDLREISLNEVDKK